MLLKLFALGCGTGFALNALRSAPASGVSMVHCHSKPSQKVPAGDCLKGLPEFTREEVQRRRGGGGAGKKKSSSSSSSSSTSTPDSTAAAADDDQRLFVTYRCGVYDVTEFLSQHPGGVKRLLLAAGGDIEPFWRQFTLHDDDNVRKILESHRVGNVKGYREATPEEKAAQAKALEAVWAKEPKRALGLDVLSQRPFNAQTPEVALEDFLTPNEMFFVRNHMPVPIEALQEDTGKGGGRHPWCVQVTGEGIVSQCIPLEVLKASFPQYSVTTTIQCGGNRRSEMAAAHPTAPAVKGLAWTNGGIGTATWTGVRLRDVIRAASSSSNSTSHASETQPLSEAASLHVQLQGADHDPAGHFHVSVPYPMVMDPNSEALIAFEMNHEPIPPDHGHPARAIIPGAVGVRNCKWLTHVNVQRAEATSVWQQHDYKNFPNWTTKPDPSLPSIHAMPIQSALTDAAYDVNQDTITVKGYAYAGGGVPVQRVELSFDGGKTFETIAPLLPVPEGVARTTTPPTTHNAWAWRLLQSQVEVDSIRAPVQISADGTSKYYRTCIRAIDSHHNTQPETAPFNFRGLLYNGYSCRDVEVEAMS